MITLVHNSYILGDLDENQKEKRESSSHELMDNDKQNNSQQKVETESTNKGEDGDQQTEKINTMVCKEFGDVMQERLGEVSGLSEIRENSQESLENVEKKRKLNSQSVQGRSNIQIQEEISPDSSQHDMLPTNSQHSHSSQRSSQSVLDSFTESLMQSSPELDDEFRDFDKENKEKFKMLQTFFHTLSDGEIEIKYKWRDEWVSDSVSHKRARLLDSMVQYLLKTIFPEANEASYKNIIDRAFRSKSENCSSVVLEKIIESYKNTQSKEVKKFLIMELTLVKKFKELQEVLPDLSMRQYKAARKLVKQTGLTKIPEPGYQGVTRNRRDYDSTVYFVDFFSTFVRV